MHYEWCYAICIVFYSENTDPIMTAALVGLKDRLSDVDVAAAGPWAAFVTSLAVAAAGWNVWFGLRTGRSVAGLCRGRLTGALQRGG